MRYKLSGIAALFAAGVMAVGIAPASAATSSAPAPAQQSCASSGGTQTVCQSPGNAQLYNTVPDSDYYRYQGGVI